MNDETLPAPLTHGIDASNLRVLKDIDEDDDGRFGLVLAVHSCDEATRYYDTADERNRIMRELHAAWRASRKITGDRPDGQ